MMWNGTCNYLDSTVYLADNRTGMNALMSMTKSLPKPSATNARLRRNPIRRKPRTMRRTIKFQLLAPNSHTRKRVTGMDCESTRHHNVSSWIIDSLVGTISSSCAWYEHSSVNWPQSMFGWPYRCVCHLLLSDCGCYECLWSETRCIATTKSPNSAHALRLLRPYQTTDVARFQVLHFAMCR